MEILSYDGSAAVMEFCSDPNGDETGSTGAVIETFTRVSSSASGGQSDGNCGGDGNAGKAVENDGNSGGGTAGKFILEVADSEKLHVGNVGGSYEYGGGEYSGAVGNDMVEELLFAKNY